MILNDIIESLNHAFKNRGHYEFDSEGHGLYRVDSLVIVDCWENGLFEGFSVFKANDYDQNHRSCDEMIGFYLSVEFLPSPSNYSNQ